MKLRRVVTLMFSIAILPLAYPAEPAAATFPCTNAAYRAGTRALNITVATGVSATIKTPETYDVYNYDSTKPTAADIYMFNQAGGGGFVQVGWYLGSASGLPNATQPRLFWGENTPTGETLHAGTWLSWGTYYKFGITNPLDGTNRFNIWLQEQIIGRSVYAHSLNAPAFNGEVNYKCTRMHGLASRYQSPLRSLQYRYGSWNYFSGTRYVSHADFFSIQGGDIATNYVYGGG
ncbi:MAG TPA: hypothetical protein VFB74_36020 [Kribbellaceae bacterium]|nr:hypothetical protein [Kribbellaceae bacterium]